MAYVPFTDKNVNKLKDEFNLNSVNKEQNSQTTNSMFVIMDDLIKSMQQLQEVIKSQKQMKPDNNQTSEENKKVETNQSQAALLLRQVQSAMESTIAQLSVNNRILKPDKNPTNFKENFQQLSTSEKWRMYTEMVQMKNEPTKEYCVMKMKFGQELGLSFKETKREMLIGLCANRLSIVLYCKEHKNVEEILNDVDEWERIEQARSEVYRKYRYKKQ